MSARLRLLIAPQELKGTLTAVAAADAMVRGIRAALPEADVKRVPMSDGGPGFVDALVTTLGGERRTTRVRGPLGSERVSAEWGIITSGPGARTALLEMAAASGLSLLAPDALDARRASTFGTGELIRAALDEGCRRLVLGLGGSATTDGGAGALAALGARFLDASGLPLPPGGATLRGLSRVDLSGFEPRLRECELLLATDVVNPLLGPQGAAAVYAPQKGADAAAVAELEAALTRFAEVTETQLPHAQHLAMNPRMGAAGGLSYGLAAYAGGRVTSGFDWVKQAVQLEEQVAWAELVLTAEGRLDSQTAAGKGPGELGLLAKRLGRRAVMFAGSVEASYFAATQSPFDQVLSLSECAPDSRTRAAEVLEHAVRDWAQRLETVKEGG